jgi:ABC-2 type transport system permease protein
VERDLRAIVRSPSEIGRAAFLALLLALYTSFIFVAPVRDAGGRPEVLARLLLLDVAAAGYFLTAFGLRFVFPSMSLEGRAAWLFFSSPIRIFPVFLAKLALYVGLLTVVVVPLVLASVLRIVGDPSVAALTGVLLLMLAVTTTGVCLGFGAAWPDFRESNPEVLATSAGGLLAASTCLVYVALMAWMARSGMLAVAGGTSALPSLVAGGALSASVTAASVILAHRRIRRLEAA